MEVGEETGRTSADEAASSRDPERAIRAEVHGVPLQPETSVLRDYTADSRMLLISVVAESFKKISTLLSWILLRLIGLSTNLFYFHHWSMAEIEPAANHLGWFAALVPVTGGLLVGLIARFGSPSIRGHGMPEAVEAVVFGGARIQPRVAFLKPIATAISIGSGGPFGAEGPVIASGGACGSLLAQFLPVTDAERAVLLVCGASAGMAATFSCPFSAVLLAVELLLFEWRPRSLVPVAIACATAGALRRLLLGPGPIFPMNYSTAPVHHQSMLGALLLGAMAAAVAVILSSAIHLTEKVFERLPLHWMWFPAIGGIFVGAGGLIVPQALGVGYGVIRGFVNADFTWKLIAGVLVIKVIIWVISLSSNTAGGILAPLLMIGAAMGVVMSHWLPSLAPGAWAVIGMTALLAASIGAPLTSAMLSVELTHNGGLLLPVLLACTTAYALSVLLQRRSLITGGLSRRGRHLAREYSVDPLDRMTIQEAMHTSVDTLPASATRADAAAWLRDMEARAPASWSHWQRIFPVLNADGHLLGLLTRTQMIAAAASSPENQARQHGAMNEPLLACGVSAPATLQQSATVRAAAERMGTSGLTSYPVIDAEGKFTGILNVADLLNARVQSTQREQVRNRVLHFRRPLATRRPPP